MDQGFVWNYFKQIDPKYVTSSKQKEQSSIATEWCPTDHHNEQL